jgi:hypothetical protein
MYGMSCPGLQSDHLDLQGLILSSKQPIICSDAQLSFDFYHPLQLTVVVRYPLTNRRVKGKHRDSRTFVIAATCDRYLLCPQVAASDLTDIQTLNRLCPSQSEMSRQGSVDAIPSSSSVAPVEPLVPHLYASSEASVTQSSQDAFDQYCAKLQGEVTYEEFFSIFRTWAVSKDRMVAQIDQDGEMKAASPGGIPPVGIPLSRPMPTAYGGGPYHASHTASGVRPSHRQQMRLNRGALFSAR